VNNESDYLEYFGVQGKTVEIYIDTWYLRIWAIFIWLRLQTCEQCNEIYDSKTAGNFFD
jgi:hypothetical protein